MRRRKKKPLSAKQTLVKDSAEKRFKIEKLVFVWQEKLFSTKKVPTDTLKRAATYLQPNTYSEVIEERVVQKLCGYPLCDATPKLQDLQKYRISITQRKVYDQVELSNYCSESCYQKSKYYSLQLSVEPVWFRDLSVQPMIQVIDAGDDFKQAIAEERERVKAKRNKEDIEKEYVKHLLSSVPKDKEEVLRIVEKDTESPLVSTPKSGVYDTLEGYQIEVVHNGKHPTSMKLSKQKKKTENKKQVEIDTLDDPTDTDALFETMMMLKEMNMDKEGIMKGKENPNTAREDTMKDTEVLIKGKVNTVKEKVNTVMDKEDRSREETKAVKKSSKKKGPEMSLFGTIWTMLDHMTTKATRAYLSGLDNYKVRLDVSTLVEKESVSDASYLRSQIFSERILETYGVIRSQLGIESSMEDDIVAVIRTFRFTDASMVALNNVQCYMMTLTLFRALADSVLDDSQWRTQFDQCCKSIGQSSDMIDACVRVLKIASV
ncbi:Rtr1/RPAP2 family-domain-containing protein [Pilobolus umbonatus]|nr:Rtr1/RPAP2 family-domain-containing protein [Pilobolus umbonatus]